MLLVGYGQSGTTHDFFAFDSTGNVWNGSSFVSWSNGSFTTYRITATETGSSGRFTGAMPIGTERYALRIRNATLALSYIVWEEQTKEAAAGAVHGADCLFVYEANGAAGLAAAIDGADGKKIIVGPGTYAMGSTTTTGTGYAAIQGAGMHETHITFDAQNEDPPLIQPAVNGRISDLTIEGTVSNNYQFPIGSGGSPAYAFTLERVQVICVTDAFSGAGSGSETGAGMPRHFICKDSILRVNYDAIYGDDNLDVLLINSDIQSLGPAPVPADPNPGSAVARGLTFVRKVVMIGGRIEVTSTAAYAEQTYGINATGDVWIIGGSVHASAPAGDVKAIKTTGKVYLCGASVDRSKIEASEIVVIPMPGAVSSLGEELLTASGYTAPDNASAAAAAASAAAVDGRLPADPARETNATSNKDEVLDAIAEEPAPTNPPAITVEMTEVQGQ